MRAREKHLYRGEGGKEEKREFEERYGKHGGRNHKGGDEIYGATVGKVKRERMAKRRHHRK